MAVVDAQNVNICLGSATILEDISLRVNAGEIVSILGASGVGKTTLLRALAGLVAVTQGQVNIPQDNPHAVGVRMVFQDPRLLPWMRVRDNITFALKASGVPRSQWSARIEPLMVAVGLEQAGNLWPSALSGGMAQRVSLVRALACRPAVLLLDEPFSALDPQRREELQCDLQRLVLHTQCAAVVVTHDVLEAVVLSDRVLVLGGRPGRMLHRLAVPAAHPRTQEFRLSEAALQHQRVLREVMTGKALK